MSDFTPTGMSTESAEATVWGAVAQRLTRRHFLGLTGGLTAGLTLSACSGSADPGAGGTTAPDGNGGGGQADPKVSEAVRARHADGILRVGIAAAPSNINPLDSGAEVTQWIAEPIMESLYEYDRDLKPVPLLAAEMPVVSEDKLKWQIKLRDDITWHNGDAFGADDVVASLAHISDMSSGSEWITYLIGFLQSYSKIDEHTVEIEFTRPYGLMLSHLTNLPIGHRDFVKKRDTMMGTGPFKLDNFVPGQTFTLSAYDGYHGEKPTLKGIVYTTMSDGSTRLVNLQQGRIDLITQVPYRNLESARNDPGLVVHEVDAPLDILFFINQKRPPFSDENFRRAVAVSLDRKGVVERVFGGAATPGQGPIGPSEAGYSPDVAPFPVEPDYDLAAEYLAKSEITDRSFTITAGVSGVAKDISEVLAAGWARAGINVTIEQLPGAAWSNSMVGVTYDIILNMFQNGFTSGPANYMTLAPADSTNVLSLGYQNDEVDALFQTVWTTDDQAERVGALEQINKKLADDAVLFPPAYPKLVLAHRAEVSAPDLDFLKVSRIRPHRLSLDA